MESLTSTQPADGVGRWLAALVVITAIALQVIVLVPFTVASGLVAPLWAMAVLYVVWVMGAGALALVARRRPLATPLVPLVNAAVLWVVITAGEALLGWAP
jgi:hypothetical protein